MGLEIVKPNYKGDGKYDHTLYAKQNTPKQSILIVMYSQACLKFLRVYHIHFISKSVNGIKQ